MRKPFLFLAVSLYTAIIAITVFSITKSYYYKKIIASLDRSYIDYSIDDFLEITIDEEQKYGPQEVNGEIIVVLPDEEDDAVPELATMLMIPAFLKMEPIPIEQKKPRIINLYI